jgi:hypothetical protein
MTSSSDEEELIFNNHYLEGESPMRILSSAEYSYLVTKH